VPSAAPAIAPLGFNQAASVATSGVTVCVVLVLVLLRLARSVGWRPAVRRFEQLDSRSENESVAAPGPDANDFGLQLAALSMPSRLWRLIRVEQ
jgi:hypothetical protein